MYHWKMATALQPITAQIRDKADFLGTRPVYRKAAKQFQRLPYERGGEDKPKPGIIKLTRAAAMIMKQTSPRSNLEVNAIVVSRSDRHEKELTARHLLLKACSAVAEQRTTGKTNHSWLPSSLRLKCNVRDCLGASAAELNKQGMQ